MLHTRTNTMQCTRRDQVAVASYMFLLVFCVSETEQFGVVLAEPCCPEACLDQCIRSLNYSAAKMHKMPYLYRLFSAEDPCN